MTRDDKGRSEDGGDGGNDDEDGRSVGERHRLPEIRGKWLKK